MHMIKFFLIIIFFAAPVIQAFAEESYCYFIPPKGWQMALPQTTSKHVKVTFAQKRQDGLCPSINLAIENMDLTLKEYVKIVESLHKKKQKTRWRNLGSFTSKAGEGQLIELDLPTKWGETRLVQFLFVKDKKAYVVTAGALKEDFSKYYKEFEKAFHSFQLTEDLFSPLKSSSQEEIKQVFSKLTQAWQKRVPDLESFESAFNESSFQKEAWVPFQEKILKCEEMGAFWQILTLAFAQENLRDLITNHSTPKL